ncbi:MULTISPECIES: hypothetical protein [unclassified Streptomyces]|uniref:hypothetical protein n=1 Tax=unclassified Streptomyces TaxID=2593676 RepID=UPI00035E6F57|nr:MULTISPECIES: hypothetical protein [unclassified Streptomyces]MYX39059.1 hypothetical protein [Streptomyces sp. SID8377]
MKWKRIATGITATAASMAFLVATPTSAAAGTCTTSGCGGEVTNNSSMNIRIANCWRDDYGLYQYIDKIGCVSHPNSWIYYNADAELPPGDESKYNYYYYDTDAVRFYKGCVTKWHWWGGFVQTTDRRGKSSQWMKISSIDHVYIDSISC